ncbi:FAD/NAD(P)-binding protein [Serratia plymuthica]
MKTMQIAIVGAGPRGLNVLERFVELIHKENFSENITLHLIDPGIPGEGCHPSIQPSHLLVNTVSSQITLYAPESLALAQGGESFIDWAKSQNYRRLENEFKQIPAGTLLNDMDYLPRNLLGKYLHHFYQRLCSMLPASVNLVVHRTEVLDIVHDGIYKLTLKNRQPLVADFVFLTTGHGYRKPTEADLTFRKFVDSHQQQNPLLAYYPTPYPIANLDSVKPQTTVLIQGFGLTAHDTISAFTLGRGGRYQQTPNGLIYLPSGREPKLRLISRQCLPFAGRGINQKGLTGRHQAQFFTPQAVDIIRQQTLLKTGDPRLNFEQDLLPLLLKEMAYAWRCAVVKKKVSTQTFTPTAEEIASVRAIIWPLEGKTFNSFTEYAAFFRLSIEHDLQEALNGNMNSPVKAATDTLRDVRESLRRSVEYGGLLPASHRYFIEQFNPIINRISFGPPVRRNQELLALMDANILTLAGGPGSSITSDERTGKFIVRSIFNQEHWLEQADVIISARLDNYSPLTDASPLSSQLLKRAIIRPFRNGDYHPGGIAIDENLNPLDAEGNPQKQLWAMGFLVEGPHYYTHALPRPHMDSRQVTDAEIGVRSCLRQIRQHIEQKNQMVTFL